MIQLIVMTYFLNKEKVNLFNLSVEEWMPSGSVTLLDLVVFVNHIT